MTDSAHTIVYFLCLFACALCTGLMTRAYLRRRSRFLFWGTIGFGFFTLNNLLLVADLVFLPDVDLWIWRQMATGAALAVMLFALIRRVE